MLSDFVDTCINLKLVQQNCTVQVQNKLHCPVAPYYGDRNGFYPRNAATLRGATGQRDCIVNLALLVLLYTAHGHGAVQQRCHGPQSSSQTSAHLRGGAAFVAAQGRGRGVSDTHVDMVENLHFVACINLML